MARRSCAARPLRSAGQRGDQRTVKTERARNRRRAPRPGHVLRGGGPNHARPGERTGPRSRRPCEHRSTRQGQRATGPLWKRVPVCVPARARVCVCLASGHVRLHMATAKRGPVLASEMRPAFFTRGRRVSNAATRRFRQHADKRARAAVCAPSRRTPG